MSQWAAALLAGALVGAAAAATLLVPWITRLHTALDEERTRRGSLASTYGRISEQWFPLTDAFPYDSRGFRFLELVRQGRVEWQEFRFVEGGPPPEPARLQRRPRRRARWWE